MKTAVCTRPSTLLRFHDYLVRRKYRALFSAHSRGNPGPKGPSQDVIDAIIELKRRNSRFGYPRIALIVSNTFGIEIGRNIVRRVYTKYYHPHIGGNGPSWLTFLGHMKDSLWSVDLFRRESITLKSHWVLVVMDQFTRRIIGFAAHVGDVDGVALCRMFNHIIACRVPPRYLSSDHDPLFEYHRWQANLRIVHGELWVCILKPQFSNLVISGTGSNIFPHEDPGPRQIPLRISRSIHASQANPKSRRSS